MSDLYSVIMSGNFELATSMLNVEAEVNRSDRFKRTPLMAAAVKKAAGLIPLILSLGADVNAKDAQGRTALHLACQFNDLNTINALILGGAIVDAIDNYGNTPLQDAVFNFRGDGSAIEKMLSNKADPNKKNNFGVSPKSLAYTVANYDLKYLFD